jgi:hypothetical protein
MIVKTTFFRENLRKLLVDVSNNEEVFIIGKDSKIFLLKLVQGMKEETINKIKLTDDQIAYIVKLTDDDISKNIANGDDAYNVPPNNLKNLLESRKSEILY